MTFCAWAETVISYDTCPHAQSNMILLGDGRRATLVDRVTMKESFRYSPSFFTVHGVNVSTASFDDTPRNDQLLLLSRRSSSCLVVCRQLAH